MIFCVHPSAAVPRRMLPTLTGQSGRSVSAVLYVRLAGSKDTSICGDDECHSKKFLLTADLQAGVGYSTDNEIAGRGTIFLIVDEVASEREWLRDVGIMLGDDMPDDYSTLAQVRDPDGNLITLATPPSPNYPPA